MVTFKSSLWSGQFPYKFIRILTCLSDDLLDKFEIDDHPYYHISSRILKFILRKHEQC